MATMYAKVMEKQIYVLEFLKFLFKLKHIIASTSLICLYQA
jgi:hypothetical protein